MRLWSMIYSLGWPNRAINDQIGKKLKINYKTESLQELRYYLRDLESFLAKILEEREEHNELIAENEEKYILLYKRYESNLIRKTIYDNKIL